MLLITTPTGRQPDHTSPRPVRRRPDRAAQPLAMIAAALALAAPLGAAPQDGGSTSLADPPDLFPQSILAPQIVETGSSYGMQVVIGNLGGPLTGPYTAEVVLSQDAALSEDDEVVATLQSDVLGAHPLLADIPAGLAGGAWHWGLRIKDVPDEIHFANNGLLGLQVSVIAIDLELADPTPIHVFVRPTDDAAPASQVLVKNAGTPGSLLLYQVVADPPQGWLTIDPPQGFAFAGQDPNPTALTVDHAALPVGSQSTTLRFSNLNKPEDTAEVPFTLEIGEPKFRVGDQLEGQISSDGEVDDIRFDAVKGMKVSLAVKAPTGDLKPIVEVFGPDGALVSKLKFPHSKKGAKKSLKLKSSGEFRLVVRGKTGQTGSYQIKTKGRVPKKAKAQEVKLKPGKTAALAAFEGATLDLAVALAEGEAPGAISLGLKSGVFGTQDLTGIASFEAGALVVNGFPLTATADYELWVDGYAAKKVFVSITPVQPQAAKKKIFLP